MNTLTVRVALLAAAGLSLGACSTYGPDGYGYSRVAVGVGSGYYADPYWGWYDGYYYPGSGYYIWDRRGYRHRWNDHHQNYWHARRGHRSVGDNWSGYQYRRLGDYRPHRARSSATQRYRDQRAEHRDHRRSQVERRYDRRSEVDRVDRRKPGVERRDHRPSKVERREHRPSKVERRERRPSKVERRDYRRSKVEQGDRRGGDRARRGERRAREGDGRRYRSRDD